MNEEQKQLIKEKWVEFCSKNPHDNKGFLMIQGIDIASDWWLNELDLAIKQTEDRIAEKIQESFPEKNYIEMAELNDYYTGKENGVIYCKNKIITLIRNNG